MSRVTIRDVAEKAGVSRQTVSRAINDQQGIDANTRARVLAVAREMGYAPSRLARGLKTNRTHTIGLVVPDIANPFFAEIARGASEVAHEHDYGVLLCNTDERADRELEVLAMLAANPVDGLVLVSSRLSEETLATNLDRWKPLVLVNRQYSADPRVASVIVDDEQGAFEAVRHLLDRGHHAIGFLGGTPDSHSGRARLAGFQRALRAFGISDRPAWHKPCAPTVAGGKNAARELFSEVEVTAVLAYNDLVAVGALQACVTMGKRVPEDTAVMGWDDIDYASFVSPSLTTMRMPKYKMGEVAMSLLLDSIATPEAVPQPVRLRAELVVRSST